LAIDWALATRPCSEVRPVLAAVQGLGGEEVGGVVESRVDLVAGGEVILGLCEQRSSRLQREEVLAD
jgi:hypothetical protein